MAITIGSLVEVTLRIQFQSNVVMNVFSYDVSSGVGEVSGEQMAEAWWNYVKDEYRALVKSSSGFQFVSVVVRQLDDAEGVLAEWNVPSGERSGTRTGVDASEFLPNFNAAGVRLTVGSRVTRPGQKRVAGLLEVDNDSGVLSSAYTTLLNTWAAEMTEVQTLSAPAATFNLTPVVFRKNAEGGVTAFQPVVGYVVNPYVTSQVSRRTGRGI